MSAARPAGGRPTLAITLGDPRGIGAEIVAKALADHALGERFVPRLVGPAGLHGLAVDDPVGDWSPGGDAAAAGRLSGLAIARAVDLARRGEVQGIVTAPIDKAALLAGGYDYP